MGNLSGVDAEPAAFDTSIAHHARIYDYLLGGKDNYAADRKAGEALKAAYPTMVELARANRAFLGRVVRFLAGEAGIRQFLDIGYTGRSHDQVMRFFTGLDLVEPGLVQVHQWRPGIETNGTLALWTGVGRKPA
jgi:S-adenosyl methyltransferase